ncbi:unnamed protein product [Symbiodinium sp. CCMP2456]|nr:unnamed protein product [Symbiodinium sp. CCMP2456]
MEAKCSFLLSVCVLATCIVAGTSSPNTTGFLAQPHMVNHSNTTGPVPQNVSDVKSVLLDLAKKNITLQDMQDILAKVGADSKTKDWDTCTSRPMLLESSDEEDEEETEEIQVSPWNSAELAYQCEVHEHESLAFCCRPRDKILTITGTREQKEQALTSIVADLLEFQGVPEGSPDICVLVMPSCAIGAVIGTKGAKISEIMAESGTDIDVGRECITGMPDNPVVLKGQRSQIVRAAVLANDVLQDLADKGRVNADDFRYIPGRTPAPRLGSRGTFSSCAAARFLFDKDFAGFIIGKGGEKITRIRDQTGATLQFRGSAEEVALFLGPDDRILDIRGTATQRNQAVEFCFKEMESAPQPIQETRVFIPLAVPEAPLEETVARTGASCSLSQDVHICSPESSERVVRLEGAASERLAATLGLLAKADEYATASAASVPSARPPVAVAPRTDRPNGIAAPSVASATVAQSKTEDSSEQRIEPETGKAYTFAEFRVAFATTYSEQDICDYWRDACTPVKRERGEASGGPGHVDHVERVEPEPVQAAKLSNHQPELEGPGEGEGEHANLASKEVKEPDLRTHPEQKASTDPAPSRDVPSCAAVSLPQWREHLVETPRSELHVVLPTALVKGPLVQQGFLAEIAVGCHVQIDVCGEIASGQLHVILSGTAAANAMAVVALQMRAWFAGGL